MIWLNRELAVCGNDRRLARVVREVEPDAEALMAAAFEMKADETGAVGRCGRQHTAGKIVCHGQSPVFHFHTIRLEGKVVVLHRRQRVFSGCDR